MSICDWFQSVTTPKVDPVTAEPVKVVPIASDGSDYSRLYSSMVIRSNWVGAISYAADRIEAGITRYKAVAKLSNVPWHLIGVIHLLEGDCDFNTHLHNGDSLKRRTVNVPAGRPRSGEPPFTWEASALDALAYDSVKPPLSTIGQQLGALERYNGMGYRNHGINSPYLWSGTGHYTMGKYVSDGRWSSTAVSAQVGGAPVIHELERRGLV